MSMICSFLLNGKVLNRIKHQIWRCFIIPLIFNTDEGLVDQEAINQVYQKIHQACKDIGFFYITGHGVEQSTLDMLFSYTKKFFDLPMEKKTALSIDNNPAYNGYIGRGRFSSTSSDESPQWKFILLSAPSCTLYLYGIIIWYNKETRHIRFLK